MSFLTGRDLGENSLVVDISSGSVGAALVHSSKSRVPEIISQIRTPFETAEEDVMLPALRTSLLEIARSAPLLKTKGFKSVLDKAVISFSSPWLTSYLKTVIISKEKKFVFDRKMLEEVMGEEKELFLSKLSGNNGKESEIFESAVTSLFQNGYETSAPTKSKVNKVEMSFIMSATEKNLIRRVGDELIKTVGLRKGFVLSSFMYAFHKVLSHSFQGLHSALLMNMSQEVTDILFLRHGSSALSASIAFGPAVIVREVASKLDIPPPIAESYLRLFSSGTLDEAAASSLEAIFSEIEEKWKKMWQNMGESIPEGKDLSYPVFLVVPAGFERFIKVFLENIFEERQVILLGETNTFTRELVKLPHEAGPDEGLLLLSSFSNLIS